MLLVAYYSAPTASGRPAFGGNRCPNYTQLDSRQLLHFEDRLLAKFLNLPGIFLFEMPPKIIHYVD